MPDEAAVTPEAPINGTPPETKATPEPGAPVEAPQTESPEVDWKQRYEDLRPEADRRASVLADIEGRNGPERQAQALEQYARIELEDDNEPVEEGEFELPPDPLDEIEAIKQELAQRDEAAQAAEFDGLEAEYIEETVKGLEGEKNLKLSDEEYDAVVNHALSNRDPHDGKPDLEGGFAKLEAIQKAIVKRNAEYAQSKDQAALAPVGATGEHKIDLKDKDARQKLGTEVFEAAERSKQT
jgi:hypothetical protein